MYVLDTYTPMREDTENKTQARNGPSGGGRPRAAFHEFPPRPDCRTLGSSTTTTQLGLSRTIANYVSRTIANYRELSRTSYVVISHSVASQLSKRERLR